MHRQHDPKTRFLNATIKVVRIKGYAATRIEDVCAEAGLSKGSFFHHFKSKEDLALAASAHWDARAADIFARAPFHDEADPRDRLIAYVDFRKAILTGDLPDFTCFAGTIVQEAYRTHPDISAACARSLGAGVRSLEADIRAAMDKYGVRADWTPESLALHMEAVVQGGFILAKARGGAKAAAESLDHLRRYLRLLFAEGSRRFAN
ncbi:TetR/AcrR family transcriptional regulator [Allomesorhizobium camelthorni]|uniref:TetR/AcrR family transcriptional regulator n=1 Tax=Allomesorhizobium camelthorni TaxID=475069 RepID=A0A6G4WJS3_9HYPH|nr:TetR/AcrR family transcriptional regulator [Mesorhizobium camelthorni]NGO55052.1 TetR/AcrR family transcriptional regulator [Mesorhizobium camelthorni]